MLEEYSVVFTNPTENKRGLLITLDERGEELFIETLLVSLCLVKRREALAPHVHLLVRERLAMPEELRKIKVSMRKTVLFGKAGDDEITLAHGQERGQTVPDP